MSDSPIDKIKSDPDIADALAYALEPINEHYRKLWAGTKANRPPLPSGPVEEFTQTPGSAEVIPQYDDFRGTEALRDECVCAACDEPIANGRSYASLGGNIVPYLPAKLYHLQCVPKIKPQEHPPVTEIAAEVLRGSDPDSESIKGPTPYSDKSPISFYSHNQAEIDRLRYILSISQTRLARACDLLQDVISLLKPTEKL